jgi:hypothetical protein
MTSFTKVRAFRQEYRYTWFRSNGHGKQSRKTEGNEKVQLAHVFTEAPSYEAIWESGVNSPGRSKPEFWIERSGQLQFPTAFGEGR